jgi:tetratricopeptide (TPR) repeat protein
MRITHTHRWALAIATIAAAAHLPALRGSFLNWDDDVYVVSNPLVEAITPATLARMATSSHAANWHPLTWLSHATDRALFGLEPIPHHAVNLALHAANAALVFLALGALTGRHRRAAAVAIVFAIHPLRTESVAWVSERKDLLCAFFFLLAVLAHARYAARPAPARYAAVFGAAALALLAKPMAVSLPLALLVLDAWPLARRRLAEKLPLFALAAAAAVATVVAQSSDRATIALDVIGPAARAANAAVAAITYLWLTLWPFALSPFYPFPGVGGAPPLSPFAVVGAAAALVAISAAAWRLRRRAPYLIVGWLWYVVTLLPVSGLVQVGSQAMADRYTYLPMIGPAMAAVWGVADLLARLRRPRATLARAVAIAWCALLIALSWRQAGFWRDSEALWRRAIAIEPRAAVAHSHLAQAFLADGRLPEAIAACRAALAIDARHEPAHFNLGLALARQGDIDEAIAAFRAAQAIRPDLGVIRYQIASRTLRLGRLEEAIAEYREAVRLDPELDVAHYDLGVLLAERGETEAAIAHYRAAIAARPHYPEANGNLAMLLLERGDREGARACAKRILAARAGAEHEARARTVLRQIDAGGAASAGAGGTP